MADKKLSTYCHGATTEWAVHLFFLRLSMREENAAAHNRSITVIMDTTMRPASIWSSHSRGNGNISLIWLLSVFPLPCLAPPAAAPEQEHLQELEKSGQAMSLAGVDTYGATILAVVRVIKVEDGHPPASPAVFAHVTPYNIPWLPLGRRRPPHTHHTGRGRLLLVCPPREQNHHMPDT